MAAPVLPRERDLRRLAGIVSEQRDDIPAHGVPLSLLADIAGQIRCDVISFESFHSDREVTWFIDAITAHDQTTDDVAEGERGRDLSYEVQHPLIRDVIYQDISGARRRVLTGTRPDSYLGPGCWPRPPGTSPGSVS